MKAIHGYWLVALALTAPGCSPDVVESSEPLPAPMTGGGTFGGVGFPTTAPPSFQVDGGAPLRLSELRTAAKTPPPISGGTLAVDKSGTLAVAADSDRDLVYVIDVTTGAVRKVQLAAGSEPGRVAMDNSKGAHVALRGNGKLIRIDLDSATVVADTDVCTHPRGVAFDATSDSVVVACLEGQLVTLEAATHNETDRKSDLPDDLRDVVVGDAGVEAVTRYRSAELLRLNADHEVKSTSVARKSQRFSGRPFSFPTDGGVPSPGISTLTPALAWRSVRSASGRVYMLHQQSQDDEIPISTPGGYGGSGPCAAITNAQITEFDSEGKQLRSMSVPLQGLSVDATLSPNGKWLAVASPGGYLRSTGTLQVYSAERMQPTEPMGGCEGPIQTGGEENQVTGVAFDDNNTLYALSREPAELQIFAEPQLGQSPSGLPPGLFFGGPTGAKLTRKASIPLDFGSMRDTGHDLFHADVGQGLACASCHGEALDDAHVWTFERIGPRRTQNMRGGLLATAPFHWDGDMMSMGHLVNEVMTRRMGGFDVKAEYATALGGWIDRQPALTAPGADAAAVKRGQTLFAAASTKCITCHSGKNFTDNLGHDVGTGASFQTPSLLGLALRAPYMHNGCAKKLEDRFEASCGGGDKHGTTSKLSAAERADLIAYLKSL